MGGLCLKIWRSYGISLLECLCCSRRNPPPLYIDSTPAEVGGLVWVVAALGCEDCGAGGGGIVGYTTLPIVKRIFASLQVASPLSIRNAY